MITYKDILNNPRKVRYFPDGIIFIASAVELHGVIGIAAWREDEKPIKRGKHSLLDAVSRDSWLAHLTIVEQGPP